MRTCRDLLAGMLLHMSFALVPSGVPATTLQHFSCGCRLEGILYSLTACAPELLKLRQPVANDLHATCAWASHACVRQSPKSRGSTASTQIQQQT